MASYGSFGNIRTNDTGKFVSFSFAAGSLDVTVSGGVRAFRSLAHFTGFADNYSAFRSFERFADATTTSSRDLEGKYISQSAGAFFGPSIPKVPLLAGSLTETMIYDCQIGKK